MRSSLRFAVFVGFFALAACGGSRSLGPAARTPQLAPLTLAFKVASQESRALGITAYADGTRAPGIPGEVVDISSGAGCPSNGDVSRTCSFTLLAPVGLDDVALTVYDRTPVDGRAIGRSVASGTVLRQQILPGRNTFGVTTFGSISAIAISPSLLVAPADGATHELPFAVQPVDAQGFYVLGQRVSPVHLSTTNDPLHALVFEGPQGDPAAFVARYDGSPASDIKLRAVARDPRAGTLTAGVSDFTPLVVSPASLDLAASQTATIAVSQALQSGAFGASVTSGRCAVSPASASPSSAGGTVTFSVSGPSSGSCTVTVAGPDNAPPASVPIPIVYGHGSLGLGIGPSKIKHIVFVVQENRSFDNIFGGLDNNGKPFPGADTVSNPDPGEPTPSDHNGHPVTMQVGKLEECWDPYHDHPNSVVDVNGGKMNGFDKENQAPSFDCSPTPAPTDYVYRYINYSEVQPYWQMGEKFAISDRMFEPSSSSSFGPHLYAVAGQTDLTIDNPDGTPWGCDANGQGTTVNVYNPQGGEYAGVFPCFSMPTLADLMDARGVKWRWYAADTSDKFGANWNGYRAINQIFKGPDWATDIVTPPSQFVTDVGGGTLESMTWISPTNATSDHPQSASNKGPAWIVSVVDAVGQSSFWNSTAIFVIWDDWGGWYDHVPPPVTGPVQTGIRVPLIVISPYVKSGYVSHVVHTSSSILHFAEETLNLPSLGQDDAQEDDLQDAFNYSQSPIPFGTPFPVKNKQEVLRAATQTRQGAARFDPRRGD